MKPHNKTSDIQRTTLKLLSAARSAGVKTVVSHKLNKQVSQILGREVHSNNFNVSCSTLELRGLIRRHKSRGDWHITLSDKGFDLGVEMIEQDYSGVVRL
ncbi:hypothetical protein EAY46_15620 [Vibrio anguillarum]|uniref:Uncharacterized protein n=1 Tax=Vibrio anguillarum TaxID=55601 RepID=A0ABR9Z7W9_VIBAN|nr:hypothetical protein [Vibrio anguillarum]